MRPVMTIDWKSAATGAVLALFLCSCGNDDDTDTAESTASLGCESGALDDAVTHVDLQHDGELRSYELYVPTSYDGTRPFPVVLNFHGFTSSGLLQQEGTKMDELAAREGFLVAYPNGLDNSWNAGVCCGRAAGFTWSRTRPTESGASSSRYSRTAWHATNGGRAISTRSTRFASWLTT